MLLPWHASRRDPTVGRHDGARRSASDAGQPRTTTPVDLHTGSSPIPYRSKTDAAYVELRRRILDGRLAPSLPLNQEQLAAELGISTTPSARRCGDSRARGSS